jgi:hypothetical protein
MASKGAETASERASGGENPTSRGTRGAVLGRRFAASLRRRGPTIAMGVAVIGGLLLLYAETLDLYRILTPSGSVSNASGSVRTGADQHAWGLGIIGVAGAVAVILARLTGQRLPALAAAMLGVIALVTALAVDLPDVRAAGVTTDIEVGDAQPAAGFWFELAGAIVLAAGAAALASLLDPRRARARQGP